MALRVRELVDAFTGAGSVVVRYRGPRGFGTEVFRLDAAGKVYRPAAHYSAGPTNGSGAG